MTQEHPKPPHANDSPAARLVLRGVVCPLNFVKAKLELEEMAVGAVLEILVDAGEPAMNVPRSFREEGQEILGQEPEEGGVLIRVRKVR